MCAFREIEGGDRKPQSGTYLASLGLLSFLLTANANAGILEERVSKSLHVSQQS